MGRDGGEAKRGEVPLLLKLDGTPAAVLRHDERKESEARASGPRLRVLRVVLRRRWPQKAAQYYHDGPPSFTLGAAMRVLRGIRSKGFPRRQKPAAAPMAHAENTMAGVEVPCYGPSLLALERKPLQVAERGVWTRR